MKTNVSTLLREFPKVRRAALSGEVVIIETREGNLRLVADTPAGSSVLGCMNSQILRVDDEVVEPTTAPDEWASAT